MVKRIILKDFCPYLQVDKKFEGMLVVEITRLGEDLPRVHVGFKGSKGGIEYTLGECSKLDALKHIGCGEQEECGQSVCLADPSLYSERLSYPCDVRDLE